MGNYVVYLRGPLHKLKVKWFKDLNVKIFYSSIRYFRVQISREGKERKQKVCPFLLDTKYSSWWRFKVYMKKRVLWLRQTSWRNPVYLILIFEIFLLMLKRTKFYKGINDRKCLITHFFVNHQVQKVEYSSSTTTMPLPHGKRICLGVQPLSHCRCITSFRSPTLHP